MSKKKREVNSEKKAYLKNKWSSINDIPPPPLPRVAKALAEA